MLCAIWGTILAEVNHMGISVAQSLMSKIRGHQAVAPRRQDLETVPPSKARAARRISTARASESGSLSMFQTSPSSFKVKCSEPNSQKPNSNMFRGRWGTDLPPLSFAVVVLEEALVIRDTVFAEDEKASTMNGQLYPSS